MKYLLIFCFTICACAFADIGERYNKHHVEVLQLEIDLEARLHELELKFETTNHLDKIAAFNEIKIITEQMEYKNRKENKKIKDEIKDIKKALKKKLKRRKEDHKVKTKRIKKDNKEVSKNLKKEFKTYLKNNK